MQARVGNAVIELTKGDISEQDTDAIVNAANTSLQLGSGVAGAIRRKGGPAIQQECNRIGGTVVGGAVITTGGSLKAKHVIHAVGPRMGIDTPEDDLLANATANSLKVADEHGLHSVAFPAISTGVFGYPVDRCAKVMLATTFEYLKRPTSLSLVRFVLWTDTDFATFRDELRSLTAQEGQR